MVATLMLRDPDNLFEMVQQNTDFNMRHDMFGWRDLISYSNQVLNFLSLSFLNSGVYNNMYAATAFKSNDHR